MAFILASWREDRTKSAVMHVFACVAVLTHASVASALWISASTPRAVVVPHRALGKILLDLERSAMAEVHVNLSSSRCIILYLFPLQELGRLSQ